jgi:predicted TIM-barrel enzyme
MGAASIATMLPLADSNRFTDRFGRREILGRVSAPVFFGACAFDPLLDIERLVAEVAAAGYYGIANFPTAIHYDGRFRAALEEARLGFGREIEMLRAARRAGLAAIGYAKTRAEVERMVAAELDVICLNFGWNAGGVRGVELDTTLDEAVHRARQMVQRVKQARSDTLCVVEGGPIVHPDDMFRVCRAARADGYIGGSTLDRVPLELSVMEATSAFKAYGLLRDASAARTKGLERAARLSRITGRSEAVRRCLARLARLGEVGIPVLLVVEAGLGRTTIARSLHALGGRTGPTDPAGAGAATGRARCGRRHGDRAARGAALDGGAARAGGLAGAAPGRRRRRAARPGGGAAGGRRQAARAARRAARRPRRGADRRAAAARPAGGHSRPRPGHPRGAPADAPRGATRSAARRLPGAHRP